MTARVITFPPRPGLAVYLERANDACYELFSTALDASRDLSLEDQHELAREAAAMVRAALEPLPTRKSWWRRW